MAPKAATIIAMKDGQMAARVRVSLCESIERIRNVGDGRTFSDRFASSIVAIQNIPMGGHGHEDDAETGEVYRVCADCGAPIFQVGQPGISGCIKCQPDLNPDIPMEYADMLVVPSGVEKFLRDELSKGELFSTDPEIVRREQREALPAQGMCMSRRD